MKKSPTIHVSVESKRGCGYRKEGGFYLIMEKAKFKSCGKLPYILEKCPCCGNGIKFSRGWTWINGRLLFLVSDCVHPSKYTNERDCIPCILSHPPEKMGLIWIGEKFYPTPQDWIDEAVTMGISRRISRVPRGFKIGEHWVCVAHIRAIPKTINPVGGEEMAPAKPAIFQVFKPSHVEYVVKKKDTKKKLLALEEKGIKLVKVVKKDEPEQKQTEMFS